jgi:predicted NBD/HSP70 family sugar kinase
MVLFQKPGVLPPLDPNYRPISLGNRAYAKLVQASPQGGIPFGIAFEREEGGVSVYRTNLLPWGKDMDANAATLRYAERLVKSLLWKWGGWRLMLAGPVELTSNLKSVYSQNGKRAFDVELMSRTYGKPFAIEQMDWESLPEGGRGGAPIGGHLEGCRIGFDLGASDYKLAAIKDGQVVFTTEIPWEPKVEKDPEFHYRKINEGLKLAASHLPKVDAIGGSSAGIYIRNQVMVASLFRGVPEDLFLQKVRGLFLRLQKEWNVPLEIINDGDVTALAGSLSLGVRPLLGIAMGSSEAGGYLNASGSVEGWLNELAFVPIDYRENAPADDWALDPGCGSQYLSQQAVIRLARDAGLKLPPGTLASQLHAIQVMHKEGGENEKAICEQIFETVGVYLGYALAQYAEVYAFDHALILGRVTSGSGGEVIIKKAREVLNVDFPEIASRLQLHLPDEKSKRVGQAVAAASLPMI